MRERSHHNRWLNKGQGSVNGPVRRPFPSLPPDRLESAMYTRILILAAGPMRYKSPWPASMPHA